MRNKNVLLLILIIVTTVLAACAPGFLNIVPVVSEPEPVSTIPANTASISGLVWHDLCILGGGEGGVPIEPSAGCVPAQDGSLKANGIREADEPGIAGVLVSLGYGACGETDDYFEVRTNADGSFAFTNLAPGIYCVVVDSLRAENSILLPGQWTSPAATASTSAAATFILTAGEQKTGLGFGWDYQFLPAPPAAENPQPVAHGRVNEQGLNLRAGPGTSHVILGQLNEGAEIEIEGRSENLQWLQVRLPGGAQGWVYYEYLDTQVTIADLPLKEAYGGPDPSPSNGVQDPRQPLNVQVSIENDLAVVYVAGFPGDSKVIARLGEVGEAADLYAGESVTTANGNAVIRFSMPSLAGDEFNLVVSTASGDESVSVRIQYFHN